MSEQLKKVLDELHGKLKPLQAENPKMQKLAQQIEAALTNQTHHRTLFDGLKENAKEFETHHPQLTGLINRIMTALSDLGI